MSNKDIERWLFSKGVFKDCQKCTDSKKGCYKNCKFYQAYKKGNKKMKDKNFEISKESVVKLFPKTKAYIDILGYESPIQIMLGQMRMEQENGIFNAVLKQGITVDKDELIKALQYDRGQYDKGYVNGYNAGASKAAQEIFEQIDDTMELICAMTGVDVVLFGRYAELKKKYTEEK